MEFDIVTIFPEMFEEVFDASLLGKARERGLVHIHTHNLRDWTTDKHNKVDDRPYGGGPGMVIKPEPVFRAVEELSDSRDPEPELVLFTPRGKPLKQNIVQDYADSQSPLILLCGHYEGFDERIRKGLNPTEISLGDYVLSGGELAAMVFVDAITRLIPDVVGEPESVEKESFTQPRLDYPQYTRPRSFRGMKVPDVLLSGDHQKIKEWRRNRAREITEKQRPDLFNQENSEED